MRKRYIFSNLDLQLWRTESFHLINWVTRSSLLVYFKERWLLFWLFWKPNLNIMCSICLFLSGLSRFSCVNAETICSSSFLALKWPNGCLFPLLEKAFVHDVHKGVFLHLHFGNAKQFYSNIFHTQQCFPHADFAVAGQPRIIGIFLSV